MQEDDQDRRKRQLSSGYDKPTGDKRQRTPSTLDNINIFLEDHAEEEFEEEYGEDVMGWLSMDESETVTELARLLETEFTLPVKVKIIDDPYSSPLIFQSSSSYVTINGNDETCGSSFSESDCSVMVGINNGFRKGDGLGLVEGGAWDVNVEEARGWVDGEGIDGSDCFLDCDDHMLAKFLGEEYFPKVRV